MIYNAHSDTMKTNKANCLTSSANIFGLPALFFSFGLWAGMPARERIVRVFRFRMNVPLKSNVFASSLFLTELHSEEC